MVVNLLSIITMTTTTILIINEIKKEVDGEEIEGLYIAQ
jgi:hypothetical protein